MNTLGDWQQSLAWKIELIYGYSVPAFVFKFGRDRVSPLTRFQQRRRVRQLATALTQAQGDLLAAGRNNHCDVIAHSFGTLLIAKLLRDPAYEQLSFGRLVLTGSLVPYLFPWSEYIARGRIEAVLNHRAGQDEWVRIAPYFFPDVDPSGLDGFEDMGHVQDFISPSFRHSDFFARDTFDHTVSKVWTQFLNNGPVLTGAKGDFRPRSVASPLFASRRFWIGRTVIAIVSIVGILIFFEMLGVAGLLVRSVLSKVGL